MFGRRLIDARRHIIGGLGKREKARLTRRAVNEAAERLGRHAAAHHLEYLVFADKRLDGITGLSGEQDANGFG